MDNSAKSAYLEYYLKIESKLPSYSDTFRTSLNLIMDRIGSLEFQPHQSWEEECGISIDDSTQMIIEYIKNDVEAWEDSPHQQTSISFNGNVSSVSNRKKKAVSSIRYMQGEFMRDFNGLEPVPTTDRHSLLCHEVSDAPLWDKYMKFPAYMMQTYPQWDTKLKEDSPRFCVTATVTGNVTRAHHDDVCVDSRIMHISGRKLWVLWDNSPTNAAIVRNRTITYGKIDLQWLLENLTPPKLYFTADLGMHYFHYIFLPHHAWHFVFTFSTSFAISGSYHSTTSLAPALGEIEEEISHLKSTTLMEKEEKDYWSDLLTRNILHWVKYIMREEVIEYVAEEAEEKLLELRSRWSNVQ